MHQCPKRHQLVHHRRDVAWCTVSMPAALGQVITCPTPNETTGFPLVTPPATSYTMAALRT
jgi:hypothetical protein